LSLDRLEHMPAEAAPARLGQGVHALQFGAPLVEAEDAAARDRLAALVAEDQEHAVRRLELRRLARRPDVVATLAVQGEHLRLLGRGERLDVGRVEWLRPRTHRTRSPGGRP